jgi:hypothetical protein
VREKRDKSPRKPRVVWSSEVREAAHCNRCGFGRFVAVEVAILVDSWLNFAQNLVPRTSCNMIESRRSVCRRQAIYLRNRIFT